MSNKIVLKLRKRGLTLKGWCSLNKFSYSYTNQIINGHGAKWRVGRAADIVNKLVSDGLWVEPKKRRARKQS